MPYVQSLRGDPFASFSMAALLYDRRTRDSVLTTVNLWEQ